MVLSTLSSASTAPKSSVARQSAVTPAWRHVDVLIIAAAGALSVIGVVMVYATTKNPLAVAGLGPQSIMRKEAVFAVAGFAAMCVTMLFDYKRYLSWAALLYVGSILLLLAAFAIGHETLGAQSWIQVGSYQIEPSELVKVTLVISLAALLASRKGHVNGRVLFVVLGLSVVPVLLIYKQDALGSALVLAVVMIGMLLMGGARGRHMVALTLVAVVGIGAVLQLGVLKQYQKDRLTTFLTAPAGVGPVNSKSDPYAAGLEYNLDQAKATIADGGLTGKGLFKGPQTNLSYVPNQSTDFIFTAVAEQFGFVGSAFLLALFGLVVWRTWRTAMLARDLAGTLICVGVLCMFTFQVFENIGMTMGIMPVAGITLPFLSYGGSSMLVDWVAIGLVVNVGMHRFA